MTEQLTLIQKIAWIQNELKAPKDKTASVKTKTGANYSYKFRNAETILADVKPLLLKHDLIITLDDELIEMGGRLFIKATAMIIEAQDKAISSTAISELLTASQMNEAQASGATSSYARKYALCGVLGIDDGDDADDAKYTPSQRQYGSAETTAFSKVLASEKQVKLIDSKKKELKAASASQYEELSKWYQTQFGSKPTKSLTSKEASVLIDRLLNPVIGSNSEPDLSEYSDEIF